jgi:hypothetical protein
MLISLHVVENGTQGLNYCRVIPYHDDAIEDPIELAEAQRLMTTGLSLLRYPPYLCCSNDLPICCHAI